MQDALEMIVAVLNLPVVRAFSLLLSLAGFGIGLYSVRRVHEVAQAQVSHFRAEHTRFLNDQRSQIDRITLQDATSAALIAETFGMTDAKAAQREALLCLYLNVLASAYAAWKNGLIEKAEYEKHMQFVFDDYRGDFDYLWSVIRNNSYVAGFEAECRAFMQAAGARRNSAPAPARRATMSFNAS